MKKSKGIGIALLFAFIGILAMPLLSAPAAPNQIDHQSDLVYFEDGDDHTSQWLIRSISDSEEFNNSRSDNAGNPVVLFNHCINHHDNIHHVLFSQTKEKKDIKLPKEYIYLINSCFTI